MPDSYKNDSEEDVDAPPSKSARKREMHALQALGESLVALNDSELQQIDLGDENLLEAVLECRAISSNGARKRHLQLIGKIMRGIDPEHIEKALKSLHQPQREQAKQFHLLEKLRDDMLAAGIEGVELAMEKFPQGDRQHLRQLLLQHQREVARSKPPGASRKLFKYLKELLEAQGSEVEDSNIEGSGD